MGSKILSTDMLMNDYIRPMSNAYDFGKYDKAAVLLYKLNSFLIGFGKIGLVDLPMPPKNDGGGANDVKTRTRAVNGFIVRCMLYFEKYSPLVDKAVGMYQYQMLQAVANRD